MVGFNIRSNEGQGATVISRIYLYGHSVAALGGDDAMVAVIVDLVVVDAQEVAVVVGVKAVRRVVVHLVPPPVALLVAVRVHPEMVVVDVRVVDVSVDVDIVENVDIAKVLAQSSNLARWSMGLFKRFPKAMEGGGGDYCSMVWRHVYVGRFIPAACLEHVGPSHRITSDCCTGSTCRLGVS